MIDSPAKETPKAAAAFLQYCELGPGRSLRKLAEKRGQNEGKARVRLATLEEWSAAHNWQERVKEYDKEQAAQRRAQDGEAARKVLLRHLSANVKPTASTQIRAAQIIIEHLVVAEELALLAEQQKHIEQVMQEAGLQL